MGSLYDNFQALKSISREELEEQARKTDFLTPREFAKLIGVQPQQVYGWIRKKLLKDEKCVCGRTVVCVSKSRAVLAKRAQDLGHFTDATTDPRYIGTDLFPNGIPTAEDKILELRTAAKELCDWLDKNGFERKSHFALWALVYGEPTREVRILDCNGNHDALDEHHEGCWVYIDWLPPMPELEETNGE